MKIVKKTVKGVLYYSEMVLAGLKHAEYQEGALVYFIHRDIGAPGESTRSEGIHRLTVSSPMRIAKWLPELIAEIDVAQNENRPKSRG